MLMEEEGEDVSIYAWFDETVAYHHYAATGS